jgi:hypothetical protein
MPDQLLGASEHPAALDDPRRGAPLGRLDQRRVLGADLIVELKQPADPFLVRGLAEEVVEVAR